VEKNRPAFKSYKPADVYSFHPKFDDYRRQGGQFSAALCLSSAQLARIFPVDALSDNSTNNMVITALINQLPVRDASTVHEYFHSAVAMKRKKKKESTL
jgi:hypothetical protein